MTKNQPSVGFLLHDAARLMRKRFDRLTTPEGLTRAQFQVLAKVSRAEGINQARLADLLDMEPISVARTLDRMEAAGWIERRRDPNDRRAYLIYMTETARPALDQLQAIATEVYADMLTGFSEAEKATLMEYLTRLHANLATAIDNADASPATPLARATA